ncbi:hypothetical protein [Spiroplasma ixodetis]|uniref:Uncharacterized protein n=1 Tax=Spiroplasma ixodetis TaxID=2141 RepID=A0ABM8BSH0_9MOLU|nr:hypothetical protein [Spiroplasma ixodetis]BDT02804.1 hypothetical protein SHM_04500 [Spiroplasma ixodetis]
MPIGTTSTAILLNINKPKHTRISKQQENKSFWWEILEMIGVQVIAVALAPFTGGLSESVALGLVNLSRKVDNKSNLLLNFIK